MEHEIKTNRPNKEFVLTTLWVWMVLGNQTKSFFIHDYDVIYVLASVPFIGWIYALKRWHSRVAAVLFLLFISFDCFVSLAHRNYDVIEAFKGGWMSFISLLFAISAVRATFRKRAADAKAKAP